MQPATNFHVRKATQSDADRLRQILNEIITIGGTTALETKFTASAFEKYFLSGPNCIICFVAESPNGESIGFQSLTQWTAYQNVTIYKRPRRDKPEPCCPGSPPRAARSLRN
jgi:L-amino acid N-acyltransferase YncA